MSPNIYLFKSVKLEGSRLPEVMLLTKKITETFPNPLTVLFFQKNGENH